MYTATKQIAPNCGSSFPIALLIPCLEGRPYTEETLSSLKGIIDLFDYIIISVNGLSTKRIQLICTAINLEIGKNHTILCTEKRLTYTMHLEFLRRKIRTILPPNAWLLFLADDDLLASRPNLINYLQLFRHANLDQVGMGNFMSFSKPDLPTKSEKQHIAPGESISPLQFLRRNEAGHLFTNISTMIVPHMVFSDCHAFMSSFRSVGRRTEYIWATHRNIKKLICPQAPTVLIRDHPSQEGRTQSFNALLRDELIYYGWIWRNQPLLRPWNNNKNNSYFTFKRFFLTLCDLVKCQFNQLSHHKRHAITNGTVNS